MKYKIMVPKAGTSNAEGTATRLYGKDELIDASEPWMESLMQTFADNGWAMELKVIEPEESVSVEAEVKPEPKPKAKPKAKAKAKKKAAPKAK